MSNSYISADNISYNEYFINIVDKAIKLSKEDISDIDAISKLGEGWVAG